MTRRKETRGQAYVITILFLAVLLAMAAGVLDIGSWYRADRKLQATVDAAALAGAQALPDSTGDADALASQYAAKNGGGSIDVSFSTQVFTNDTITVEATRPAPGFFSKILGVDSVTVGATASARTGYPTEAKWVMPIVVDENHPMLQCDPNPCSDPTELVYQHFKKNGSPDGSGNFGFINLTGDKQGTSDLGALIENGWDEFMALGNYDAVTGNMFSSTSIDGNLEDRIGDILLFPIYRKLTGTGTGAKYEIVGWAGFRLTGIDVHGSNEKLFGNFESVTWEGIQAESAGDAPPDFGVKTVSLVN
ncbi:MAG TPA: flp pilus-assembly TadE/G-like family protein [Gaiellaceae bacterium]|nr:flp pilus-assembly TadE/G-like family protein [Gaiellaceae bacterium]